VRLGIVPAVISPFVIEKIGEVQARRYFQTGEIFSGERAERIGLVSEAVPEEELDDAVERVLGAARGVAPRASRAAKALVEHVGGKRSQDVRAHCAELIAELRAGAEAQEGMSAFLAKRPPSWPQAEAGPRSAPSPEAGS
jgi:methylglutaconyl-CoA hydratase